MNEYLVKQLRKGRASKGLKQSYVAEQIGVKGNTLSNYENGVSEPDIDTFCALCDIYDLDPAEILGEAYGLNVQGSNFNIKPSEIEHIKKYRSLDPYGQETVSYILDRESARVSALQNKEALIKELKNHPAGTVKYTQEISGRIIQYFQKVSAGTGEVIFDDEYFERITIPDTPKYRRVGYAVKVSGRSMEPLYNDGDMLLIEPTCTIDVGEVGIFNVDGEAFVKKRGENELISLNAGYKNIPLTNESRCMGRVIDRFSND